MVRTLLKLTPLNPKLSGQYTHGEHILVLCDTTIGAFSCSVPSADVTEETEFIVKNVGNTGFSLTLSLDNSRDTFSDNTTALTILNGETVTVRCNMANRWEIIGHDQDSGIPAHTQAWSTITATPTTLAGYGITDAAALTHTHSDYLNKNGTVPLTAAWDAGSWQIQAETFKSDVATGTAPLTIASETVCTHLNADLLDGNHAAAFALAGAAPASHQLDGALHTVSGLTSGHFLKATGATSFGFAAHGLTYADVGALPSTAINGTATYIPKFALGGASIVDSDILIGAGTGDYGRPYSSLLFKSTQDGLIGLNTTEGSDDRYMAFCAGSSGSALRGAGFELYGNEYSSVPSSAGSLIAFSGNAAAAFVQFNAIGASGTVQFKTADTLRMQINNTYTLSNVPILFNPTDGLKIGIDTTSYNKYLVIGAGKTESYAEGPLIYLIGGSYGSGVGGVMYLHCGSTAGAWTDYDARSATGSHRFKINGADIARITSSGLGIGITSPLATVQANGTFLGAAGNGFQLNAYYSSGWKYVANGYGLAIWDTGSDQTRFSVFANNSGGAGAAATEIISAVIKNSTGQWGFNTTTPTATVSVAEKAAINSDGGYMIKLTNKTGGNSVKGQIVSADTVGTDNAVYITPADGDMPIGVFYEAGVADGAEAWVVVAGKADVLFKDTVAPVRGYVAHVSSTAGRADQSASIPSATQHWREIGHVLESKSSGTNILAKCVLHFN